MSEVSLLGSGSSIFDFSWNSHRSCRCLCWTLTPKSSIEEFARARAYWGTSLIRNSAHLGPYSRTMSRALWKLQRGACFLWARCPCKPAAEQYACARIYLWVRRLTRFYLPRPTKRMCKYVVIYLHYAPYLYTYVYYTTYMSIHRICQICVLYTICVYG